MELLITALFQVQLQDFLFGTEKSGSCFHQFPHCHHSSTVERSNFFCATYQSDYPPPATQCHMEPIFVSDLKVASTDYEKAFIETAAYAVRIMEDREGRATYHCILVGLPMTLEHISLCLYVEVPEKVMCITIQKVSCDDTQGLRNLFCILYIVIYYLKDNPVRKNKITHTYEMPIEAAVSTTVVNSSKSKLAVVSDI